MIRSKPTQALLILLVSLAGGGLAQATQVLQVVDGQSVHARISADALTRIAIEGGRITRVTGQDGTLMVRADKSSGDIYVKPMAAYRNHPINIFVIDGKGHHYMLLLSPVNVPAETILLQPKYADTAKALRWEKSQPYVDDIKDIVRAMALGTLPPGYQRNVVNKQIPLWKQVRFTVDQKYMGATMHGVHCTLKNINTKRMRFVEREFFTPGTLAVALGKLVLSPGESTNVYIVKDGGYR